MFITAEEIKELWAEYENNSSLEANLVKDFDKVHMLPNLEVSVCVSLDIETKNSIVLGYGLFDSKRRVRLRKT